MSTLNLSSLSLGVGLSAVKCTLKGYAQLGVGQKNSKGLITFTDNDIIEKSNLKRQFLFRMEHIQVIY